MFDLGTELCLTGQSGGVYCHVGGFEPRQIVDAVRGELYSHLAVQQQHSPRRKGA